MSDDAAVVDAVGRRCPLPIIDLARAARTAADGTELELLADDPAAASDVAAWCGMRGHELVATTDLAGGVRSYRVRIHQG